MTNLSLNLLLYAQGADNAAIGVYNSAIVAGTIAVALPLGLAGRRLGYRRVLVAACSTTPLAIGVLALAPLGPIKLLGAFLLGGSESVYFTAGYPHMTENIAADHRLWLYSRSASLYYAGMFCGYLLGGVLSALASYVEPPGGQNLSAMRVVLAIAALVAAANLVPLLRTGPPTHPDIDSPPVGRGSGSRVHGYVPVYLLTGLGTGALAPFTQIFLAQRFSMSALWIGVVLAASQLCSAITTLMSDRVATRVTSTGALLVIQVAIVPFTAGIAFGTVLLVILLSILARGALADMQEPILNGRVMGQAAAGDRAISATLNHTAWLFGLMAGASLSGLLQQAWGFEAAFAVTLICAIAICPAYASMRWRERASANLVQT
jgi:MFS family permease